MTIVCWNNGRGETNLDPPEDFVLIEEVRVTTDEQGDTTVQITFAKARDGVQASLLGSDN